MSHANRFYARDVETFHIGVCRSLLGVSSVSARRSGVMKKRSRWNGAPSVMGVR